jgi:hypothetical protein
MSGESPFAVSPPPCLTLLCWFCFLIRILHRALENGQFFIDKKDSHTQGRSGFSLSLVINIWIDFYFEHMIHPKLVKKEKKLFSTFRNISTDKYISRPSGVYKITF